MLDANHRKVGVRRGKLVPELEIRALVSPEREPGCTTAVGHEAPACHARRDFMTF